MNKGPHSLSVPFLNQSNISCKEWQCIKLAIDEINQKLSLNSRFGCSVAYVELKQSIFTFTSQTTRGRALHFSDADLLIFTSSGYLFGVSSFISTILGQINYFLKTKRLNKLILYVCSDRYKPLSLGAQEIFQL